MRKLLKIFSLVAVLILLAFWSPWNNWDYHWSNVLGIESKKEFSSLKIKSFAGEMEVFVDEESVGYVSDNDGFLEIYPIEPGEHSVRLTRPDDETGFYQDVERKLNFEKEVDVVIGYDLGPTDLFSEGHVLTARRSYTLGQNPTLDIVSALDDVNVKIDGLDVGKTPLRSIPMSTDSTHVLVFQKKGFDPLEIELFPEDGASRAKLKDLELTLEVNLFVKPVDLTGI